MAFGDLDGDGDYDLLAGSNMDKTSSYDDYGVLLYYENTMNEYGTWQSGSYITRPDPTENKIEWIATGDIDGDGDIDFAYSTGLNSEDDANNVIVFNNTYGAQGVLFLSYPDPLNGVQKIALEDMTGDGCADLIVLANGEIDIFDMTQWSTTPIAELPSDGSDTDICDFDIADVNQDGMLDIVTVDSMANSDPDMDGVWVNNYTENEDPNEIHVSGEYYGPNGTGTGNLADMNDEGDSSYTIAENTTGDDIGKVDYYFRMESPLEDDTDPQLVVRARLNSDAVEVFYVWYSTDSDWATGKYTPVMVIRNPGTSFQEYTYDLPSTVAGSTYFWVKVTDSSTQLGTTDDQIDIAYLAIVSDRFGTYMPVPPKSIPTRYMVVSAASPYTYTCARALNFDGLGDGVLEVAVARNGQWTIYDNTTEFTSIRVTDANFYTTPVTPGLSTSVKISNTLFEVYDINGDGYTDILTTWRSVGTTSQESLLKLYLNMYPDGFYEVDVKDLFAGMLAGTEKGCIVKVIAADVYLRT
jgi:hypothetical protein